MLAVYLRKQLLGIQGLLTAGVTLVIENQPLTIYAKVWCICADYDGIRIGWDWRGANCIRCCLRCANVFKKNTDLATRLPNSVEITCTDKALLIERTNQDFLDDVDLVTEAGSSYAQGRITQAAFQSIVQATAQNFNPLGSLANAKQWFSFKVGF